MGYSRVRLTSVAWSRHYSIVVLNRPGVDAVTRMTTAEVRAIIRPAYLRQMSWLMPRLLRVRPYISYVLVSARKPATPVMEAP